MNPHNCENPACRLPNQVLLFIVRDKRAAFPSRLSLIHIFARIETILPAPESSHAIRAAIDEALRCKETGEAKTILFGLTGTGYFDMAAYTLYYDGKMTDRVPTDAELEAAFAKLPDIGA